MEIEEIEPEHLPSPSLNANLLARLALLAVVTILFIAFIALR